MNRSTSLSVLTFSVFNLLPGIAFGQSISLNPIADSRILKIVPNQNFGSEGLLATYNNMDGFGDNEQHSLLKFDLSSIPKGANITSATLLLSKRNDGYVSNGVASYVFRVITDWTESKVTWNKPTNTTSWTNLGGDFVGMTGAYNSNPYAMNTDNPAGATLDWNVTSLVSEWESGAVANDGLLLRADVGNQLHFYSREVVGSEPSLIINYSVVPEPGALTLVLCAGLTGTSMLLRHRRT